LEEPFDKVLATRFDSTIKVGIVEVFLIPVIFVNSAYYLNIEINQYSVGYQIFIYRNQLVGYQPIIKINKKSFILGLIV